MANAIALSLAALVAHVPPALAAPLGLERCGEAAGVYQCSGLVETWDGVPLDTTLTLPRPGARGRPLVVLIHGFGNSKHAYLNPADPAYTGNALTWARAGYSVLTYTARGLWGSCGTPAARLASPAGCARGYLHLADVRYEVRDTQELVGRLVDEGIADPKRVAAAGDSYGGGQSLMLAALRDRVMLPDGSLRRWRSPSGRPIRLAAAAPVIAWSDLVSAAAPNGRVSPTGVTGRRAATRPVGIEKATFVNAIFAAAQVATGPGQPVGEPFVPGRPMGYVAVPGTDPEADVTTWVARTTLGEPYDDESAREIVALLTRYHSAYYLPASRKGPAPLLLAAGFTDDLFPVDESLRFANRMRRDFPRTPLSLFLGDFGHQRASQKPRERARLVAAIRAWFDEHLRGIGRARRGVTAYLQECPREAPSGKPLRASNFGALAGRRMTLVSQGPQTIAALGGNPLTGVKIDPVTGGGDACARVDPAPAARTATMAKQLGRRGVTLVGAPRVDARLSIRGAKPTTAQIAARLWDVAPSGRAQVLVGRGTFRPAREGRARWFLHPSAWRFEPGHTIKLELLGNDIPYARPSNGLFTIVLDELRMRLPVRGKAPRGR